jgi:protein-disulfide isomerase
MRIASSVAVLAVALSFAAAPSADAWMGSSFNATLTKYDIRAAIKARKPIPRKAVRPASVALPSAAKGGLIFGNAEAPTTIVMFTDIECPFCKRFHAQTYPSILRDYVDTGAVRFVVRHFPLSFHRSALPAAKAVVCARAQGDALARILYGKLIASSTLTTSAIASAAADAGLDADALATCVSADSTAKTIEADIAAGTAATVAGTPSFLIIGPGGATKQINGAYPFASFTEAIDAVQP